MLHKYNYAKLKIWIDFLTPKQLLFFEPLIKKLSKKHELLCTSRDYREAKELAKIRKLDVVIVGRHGGGDKAGKLLANIDRMNSLFKIIQKFKPELTLSFCSPDASRMSFGLGIKHIAFCNSPHHDKVMRLTIPLLDKLLIPKHIPKKAFTKYGISPKNVIQYNAMDEYLIVKGKTFRNTVPKLHFKKKKTLLFRTHEIQAAYPSKKVDTIGIIKKISVEFPDFNIIVLGRYYDEIKSLKKKLGKRIVVLDEVVDSGEILSLCDVFIGSGGTMTSEAILRGVPTLSYNGVPNHDEKYLVRLDMLPRAESLSKIVEVTNRLLNIDKKKLKLKAKKFLDSMENPHSKLYEITKL
jgi:predicted glycosyltransferase